MSGDIGCKLEAEEEWVEMSGNLQHVWIHEHDEMDEMDFYMSKT
jgi:hypothetical protein